MNVHAGNPEEGKGFCGAGGTGTCEARSVVQGTGVQQCARVITEPSPQPTVYVLLLCFVMSANPPFWEINIDVFLGAESLSNLRLG